MSKGVSQEYSCKNCKLHQKEIRELKDKIYALEVERGLHDDDTLPLDSAADTHGAQSERSTERYSGSAQSALGAGSDGDYRPQSTGTQSTAANREDANHKQKAFSVIETAKKYIFNRTKQSTPTPPPLPRLRYHAIVTGETFGAHVQILDGMKGLELVPTNPANCDLVLLFCVIKTRVGSDVQAAMEGIPEAVREKPLGFVLMQHQRKPDLPKSDLDWVFKYENVKFHVEVLYHQSIRGLLLCNRNNEAQKDLAEYCATYAK